MSAASRIVILTLIAILGAIGLFLIFDAIYGLIYISDSYLKMFDWFGIILHLIFLIGTISSFHAFRYQILRIEAQRMAERSNTAYIKPSLWYGNVIYGVTLLLIALQILKVTLVNQLAPHVEPLRINYLYSIILLILGMLIVKDALQFKKQIKEKEALT